MNEPMSSDRLARIKVALEATTSGEWRAVKEAQSNAYHLYTGHWEWHEQSKSTFWSKEDMEFAASAHNEFVPKLIAEVEQLREALKCIEWVVGIDEHGQYWKCPWCGARILFGGHFPSCKRQIALGITKRDNQ